MDFYTLSEMIMSKRKGSFVHIVWEKELELKKGFKQNTVVKKSECIVRVGVAYDNMKSVRTKRATGELKPTNQGLSYGEWVTGKHPYFIEYRDRKYLRVALTKNNKIKTQFFLNGKPVNRADVIDICLAKDLKEVDGLDVINLGVENIVSIS